MSTAPVAAALASTARLVADIELAVTVTGRKGAQRVGSTGHRTYPMPVNLDVADARELLRRTLRRAAYDVWQAIVADLRDFSKLSFDHPFFDIADTGLQNGPAGAGPKTCATWLLAVHMRAPSYVEPFAESLVATYATVEAMLSPADNSQDEGSEVGRRLQTAIVASRQWLTATEVETATAATGERIKASTVRVWASRGKLNKREIDGRTVYNLGDVLACRARRDGLTAAA